jgi:putative Mg2+ transporter-C (MgtC) family protein
VTISIEQAAIDLAVAGGLSALIGFERQWRNRLAGLRTNTLVALGSATFVIFESCRNPEEAHVRALLLQGLAGGGLALRRLDSNDLEGPAARS